MTNPSEIGEAINALIDKMCELTNKYAGSEVVRLYSYQAAVVGGLPIDIVVNRIYQEIETVIQAVNNHERQLRSYEAQLEIT